MTKSRLFRVFRHFRHFFQPSGLNICVNFSGLSIKHCSHIMFAFLFVELNAYENIVFVDLNKFNAFIVTADVIRVWDYLRQVIYVFAAVKCFRLIRCARRPFDLYMLNAVKSVPNNVLRSVLNTVIFISLSLILRIISQIISKMKRNMYYIGAITKKQSSMLCDLNHMWIVKVLRSRMRPLCSCCYIINSLLPAPVYHYNPMR